MKKLVPLLLALVMMLTAAIPLGAAYSGNDYTQSVLSNIVYKTPAVKWSGNTVMKPDTYYYTTANVYVNSDFVLPEGSVLDVRKSTLRIKSGATLTINGELIIDYKGKVNPYKGSLVVSENGCLNCYGKLAVSQNGNLNVNGEAVIYDGGSLTIKGTVIASDTGRIINCGKTEQYKGAKINADIENPLNITNALEAELADKSDDVTVNVLFNYYDSAVMESTTLNGMNYLDLAIKLQNELYIPMAASEQLFDGGKGSRRLLSALLNKQSTPLLRYMKTKYGSSKTYAEFTRNSYFTNVSLNKNYDAASSAELNFYTLSKAYNAILDARIELAGKLNENLLFSLINDCKITDAQAQNIYMNGYGVFSAKLTKKQIYSLSADSRFLFLSTVDENTVFDGTDRLYLANGFGGNFSLDELDAYFDEYGKSVSVVLKGDICKPNKFSNEVTNSILKYTEFNTEDFGYSYYDTGIAGYRSVKEFGESVYGMFGFHSFTDDLMNCNGNINLNRIYVSTATGVSNYVYHLVAIETANDIKALIADENVVLILPVMPTDD